MGIQMLTGFDRFQSYYRTSEIPKVSVEEVKNKEVQKQQELSGSEKEDAGLPFERQEDHRSAKADLENISLTFHKEETYDYIGSESGLANLDMQKAISDMRKDEILQGYQYFVGSAGSLFQSEDGIVIPK